MIDPAVQKIFDDVDAQARRRVEELLPLSKSDPLWGTRARAFCLGYKTGLVDLNVALHELSGVTVPQMLAICAAALAWRDDPSQAERLRIAVDAARSPSREDTP